jgi:hypothetical protein
MHVLEQSSLQNPGRATDTRGATPDLEHTMGRHRTLGGLAVIATAVAVPMLLFMRTRPRDYRRTREFRALVGDYVI